MITERTGASLFSENVIPAAIRFLVAPKCWRCLITPLTMGITSLRNDTVDSTSELTQTIGTSERAMPAIRLKRISSVSNEKPGSLTNGRIV